jgi:hypothetical protein
MVTRPRRSPAASVLTALVAGVLVAMVALTAGCSGDDEGPLAKELSGYTDPGDGCAQVVSAISYADDVLKPAGQEQYQTFDEVVRSRLAAVDGTIALEVRDFPDDDILDQARTVGKIADRTAAAATMSTERVSALREYRREAAQLVIDCGPYVDKP